MGMGWGELDARKPASCVLRAEMGDWRGAACDVPVRGEERRHAAARVSSACGGVRGKGKDYGLDAWCPGVDCLCAWCPGGWWLVLVVYRVYA